MNKKTSYWSYSEEPKEVNIIIEYALKYADVDSIKMIIAEHGIDKCRTVWEKTLLPDDRLRKLNFFLARFIFNISLEDKKIDVYLKKHTKKRIERIYEIHDR